MIELTSLIPLLVGGFIGWRYLSEAYAEAYAEAIGIVGLVCVAAAFLVPATLLLLGVQSSGAGVAFVLVGFGLIALAVGWYMPTPDRSRSQH